ncbi:FAD:protein FMN transferase [Mesobacillus thioparans]
MIETRFRGMNSGILLSGMDLDNHLEIKRMIMDFEQKASRFIPDNQLAFVNHSPLDVPIYLDPVLADLLDQSLKLARKSDHHVHPFLGKEMMANGYTESFHEQYQPVFSGRTSTHFAGEPIERLSKRWIIKKRDFLFDFGGFGKGYIIDKGIRHLKQKDVNHFLINAGGDVKLLGTHEVGIEHPVLMGEDMIRLSITDQALVTSGKNYRRWTRDHQHYHHILDGRTGEPAFNGVLQASVIAHSAMEAETAAKLLCILPFEEAKALLYRNFPRIAYFVYFENDQIAIGGDSRLYKRMEVAK